MDNIQFDHELEHYRSFFDHEWSKAINAVVEGTEFDPPTFALCVSWKAAANSCVLPWLMVESMAQYGQGILGAKTPFAARYIAAISEGLSGALGQTLSNTGRRKLAKALREIGAEVERAYEVAKREGATRAEDIWTGLLATGSAELPLALWGSPRTSYTSIFHAYENFLRQCTAVAIGEAGEYRPKSPQLLKDAKTAFGGPLADECLEARPVRIARLIRNSLAHNGGTVTSEFAKPENAHTIAVVDGRFQIMPYDTRALFNDLKGRALRLAEFAVTLPQLKPDP
jgi:hypothetical protein